MEYKKVDITVQAEHNQAINILLTLHKARQPTSSLHSIAS